MSQEAWGHSSFSGAQLPCEDPPYPGSLLEPGQPLFPPVRLPGCLLLQSHGLCPTWCSAITCSLTRALSALVKSRRELGSGLWRLLQGPWLSVHVFTEVPSLFILSVWVSLISLREGSIIDQFLGNPCLLGYAPHSQFTEPQAHRTRG